MTVSNTRIWVFVCRAWSKWPLRKSPIEIVFGCGSRFLLNPRRGHHFWILTKWEPNCLRSKERLNFIQYQMQRINPYLHTRWTGTSSTKQYHTNKACCEALVPILSCASNISSLRIGNQIFVWLQVFRLFHLSSHALFPQACTACFRVGFPWREVWTRTLFQSTPPPHTRG